MTSAPLLSNSPPTEGEFCATTSPESIEFKESINLNLPL